MPGRDRTGPVGQGPMTGWGRGMCGGGGGYGRGRCFPRFGRGMGWGGVYAEPMTRETEEDFLRRELELTESRAAELRARLGRGESE